MYYRFTLSFCGEPQGIGFLRGFDDVGLPSDAAAELYAPFEGLAVPELHLPAGQEVEFWFTEAGLLRYANAINAVINTIEEYGWSVMGGRTPEVNANDIVVFSDEEQIALLTGERTSAQFAEITSVWQLLPH